MLQLQNLNWITFFLSRNWDICGLWWLTFVSKNLILLNSTCAAAAVCVCVCVRDELMMIGIYSMRDSEWWWSGRVDRIWFIFIYKLLTYRRQWSTVVVACCRFPFQDFMNTNLPVNSASYLTADTVNTDKNGNKQHAVSDCILTSKKTTQHARARTACERARARDTQNYFEFRCGFFAFAVTHLFIANYDRR